MQVRFENVFGPRCGQLASSSQIRWPRSAVAECTLLVLIDFFPVIFCAKNFNFDQTNLFTGLKTKNLEELSIDLIFLKSFWKNMKRFSKQNFKLTIYSKPDRNQSKLTVWQWQSAARLWGLGVLLLFSLVVGSAHKYQSDQYLPFVSQAKLEVSYAIQLQQTDFSLQGPIINLQLKLLPKFYSYQYRSFLLLIFCFIGTRKGFFPYEKHFFHLPEINYQT